MSTITDALKDDLTDSCKKAWAKLFDLLEGEIKKGMQKAESE